MGKGIESRSLRNAMVALGAAAELSCAEVQTPKEPLENPVTQIEDKPLEKRNRAVETKELPKGAFGMDSEGKPFGLDFNDHEYFKKEPVFKDLVSFLGRDSKDQMITVKLREQAFNAFQQLVEQGESELGAISALKNRNLEISSGFRSFKEQSELRRRYETVKGAPYAEKPGRSEHHLGTAIDIRSAKMESVYNWLVVGSEKDRKDPGFVPPLIKNGFVPTVSSEPWHVRFVGKEMALEYWKKHGSAIIQEHTRRLSSDPKPQNGNGKKK